MYKYYRVMANYEGHTEQLFGSYDRTECVEELDAERDSWKDEGYKGIKIISETTNEAPCRTVYTKQQIAEMI